MLRHIRLYSIYISLIAIYICTASISIAREPNLGDLSVRFCNDKTTSTGTKTLELSTIPNQPKEVCLYMQNSGPEAIRVAINFVDGTITNDLDQKKACMPEKETEAFGKHVYFPDKMFEIQPGQTLQTTGYIKFPEGYAGLIPGCVTAHLLDADDNVTGVFQVVARRASFIDVYVSGQVNIGLGYTGTNDVNNIMYDDNLTVFRRDIDDRYVLQLHYANTGNVPVVWTADVRLTYLGFLTTHYTVTQQTMGHQRASFDVDLPTYLTDRGGAIDISVDTIYTPSLSSKQFDTQTWTKIDKSPKTISISSLGRVAIGNLTYGIFGVLLLIVIWIYISRSTRDE